jgi:hypothetical protein
LIQELASIPAGAVQQESGIIYATGRIAAWRAQRDLGKAQLWQDLAAIEMKILNHEIVCRLSGEDRCLAVWRLCE